LQKAFHGRKLGRIMCIDLIKIGPITVHGYGFMIALGIFIAFTLVSKQIKPKGYNEEHVLNVVLISIGTGLLGSKLFYILLNFKELLENPLSVIGSEGFVVYGGIIIGTLCGYLYCRKNKLEFIKYANLIISVVPLCQAFGRLGCFMAGCCYGKETTLPIGVTFPVGSMAPVGLKLLPTQLISSFGNLCIFCVTYYIFTKSKHENYTVPVYLLLYSVGRFCIEFLRGDAARGFVGILSTSQFISIFIFAIAIIFWVNLEKSADSKK